MPEDQEIVESETDLKNDEWFKDNYLDLIQKNPRDWIAVMDQKIIAISSTESEVEALAKKIAGEREYSVYFVAPTALETDVGYQQKE